MIREDVEVRVDLVPPRKCCAIVLAAGGGTRFQAADTDPARPIGHKLLAPLRGRPVSTWALEAVAAAGFEAVIVVTGSVSLDPSVTGFASVVNNPRWAEGQATSLQCGLQAAGRAGMDAAVVGLGDQPFITTEAWQAVAASPTEIAVATYAGQRGNPVLLRRSIWHLLPSEGDQGARSLIARRPELVTEVACTGSPVDIDTMEDLQQWNSSTNSP